MNVALIAALAALYRVDPVRLLNADPALPAALAALED